jgi:hypothetical protein
MRIPKARAERFEFLRGVEHSHSLSRRNPPKLGLGQGM